jgi:fructuronate reductase
LREIADLAKKNPTRLVDGFLSVREVFGTDLPKNHTFRMALIHHVQSLFDAGALRTVQGIVVPTINDA